MGYRSLTYFLVFLGFFGMQSCDYVEETPPEDPSCLHRFAISIEVLSYESKSWDNFSGPDLRVDLKPNEAMDWVYSTNTHSNANGQTTLNFTSEFYLGNEDWKIQLVDDDSPDSDDIMFWDIFNPTEKGENGFIVFEDEETLVKFRYEERE